MKRLFWLRIKIAANIIEIVFVVLVTYGYIASLWHTCPTQPLPSVSYVQREINKAKADWQTPLVVDGVAGSKTISA